MTATTVGLLPPAPARVHFGGIGGIGTSGLARILKAWGYEVTGSDGSDSPLLRELEAEGIRIAVGHTMLAEAAAADLVVMTAAARDDNPEIVAARVAGKPVVKRAALLGALHDARIGIAVAGSHGKSSTSGMLASALLALGAEPSYAVGAVLAATGTNAAPGTGPHFVAEADEYDRSFLHLHPAVGIVTNVEYDHPDIFPDRAAYDEAFARFVGGIRRDGSLVIPADDSGSTRVLKLVDIAPPARVVTFGEHSDADWTLSAGDGSWLAAGPNQQRLDLALQVPGRHMARNALAALATLVELGFEGEQAAAALATYAGVGRRFERKGEAAGVLVIDDYAHHPTEIAATLRAARERFPDRRVWAVFQPHTYSRLKAMLPEFAAAFGEADRVAILDVYAARETDTLGVSSDNLRVLLPAGTLAPADPAEAARELDWMVAPGDIVLTLGAGSITEAGPLLLELLRQRAGGDGETGHGEVGSRDGAAPGMDTGLGSQTLARNPGPTLRTSEGDQGIKAQALGEEPVPTTRTAEGRQGRERQTAGVEQGIERQAAGPDPGLKPRAKETKDPKGPCDTAAARHDDGKRSGTGADPSMGDVGARFIAPAALAAGATALAEPALAEPELAMTTLAAPLLADAAPAEVAPAETAVAATPGSIAPAPPTKGASRAADTATRASAARRPARTPGTPIPGTALSAQPDSPMRLWTTWRVGGSADLLVRAGTPEEVAAAARWGVEQGLPVTVVGGGSNLLVGDGGIRGLVVLCRTPGERAELLVEVEDLGDSVRLRVGANAPLSWTGRFAAERGWAGLDWAVGLPGTVGGATVNNAGAHGTEQKDHLETVDVLDLETGDVATQPAAWLEPAYRHTRIKAARRPRRWVVLRCTMLLPKGDRAELVRLADDHSEFRKRTQPGGATGGSTFANPPGDFAGRLLEAAGMKEARIGGAAFSPLHANWIVNDGGASAADIRALIALAKSRVHDQFGVELRQEVEELGEP